MGKCSACQAGECKGEYERRRVCRDSDNCTCTCHEEEIDSFLKGSASILVGTAAVVCGVMLTAATGGVAVVGGLVVGAGSSMMTKPIAKKISGERMTAKDYVIDVVVSSVVGVASGGIGAGGSLLSNGASPVARISTDAAAGATSGLISETIRAINGEEVSAVSFGRSMGMGVVCRGVTGASNHLLSNVSTLANSEVGKAATRIGAQAVTSAATDVTQQVMENGGDFTQVDVSRVALTATRQAIVATATEGGRGLAQRRHAYNKTADTAVIEEDFSTDKTKTDDIKNTVKEANSISETEIEHRKNVQKSDGEKMLIKEKHKALVMERKALGDDRRMTGSAQKSTQKLTYCRGNIEDEATLRTKAKIRVNNERINAKIHDHSVNNGKQNTIGENKFYSLNIKRTSQAAMDILDQNQNRGAERIKLYSDPGKMFLYASHIIPHDYQPATGQRPCSSPHDDLKPDKFLDPVKKIDEDDDDTKNRQNMS